MPLLESVVQDLRFALRQVRRSPGFAVVALAAIAIGIGANSTIFSFLSAIYLRTLPVRDAQRLVAVHAIDPRSADNERLTAAEYAAYREHASCVSGLAAQDWAWTWLSDRERSIEWQGGRVSTNYFDVLGISPHVGRFFAAGDDSSVAVLSYRAWTRSFDGDPDVVGRALRLNQKPYTVIGVAPRDFAGMYVGDSLDVWTIADEPGGYVVGRLAPGRSLDEAGAELALLAGQLASRSPAEDKRGGMVVEPLKGIHPTARHGLALFPGVLAGVTACVLAIACANLAGLQLARSDSRRAEIALRIAVGASRGRVVRQLLTESLLVSVSGGVLGLGVAVCGCRLVEQFFGYHIPDMRLALDWPVAGASLALSVITGIVFGLAPAWQATRPDLAVGVRERRIAGSCAVAAQIALSVVLLVSAGLLLQSLRAVFARPGLDPERIAHFRLRPSRLGYSLERARNYQRELLRRLHAVPGVEGVVMARVPPDRGWCCEIDVGRPGEPPFQVEQNEVIPGFLPSMGIHVVQGRDFLDGDRDVVIVNQALADRLWPGQPALGRELQVEGRSHLVIGMAAAFHALRPGEPAHPYLFLPMWSRDARDPRLFVTVSGRAAPMLDRLRREVVSVDPEVHVGQESTVAGRTAMSHQRERLMAVTLEFAGAAALLLSAIGLYGLMAFQVSRRTREIGIRMALGARPGEVALWTLRWALTATGAGLAAGLLAAWHATQLLTGFLFGVTPRDVFTFAAASLVLATVAVAASVLPARRAARLEPAVALRQE